MSSTKLLVLGVVRMHGQTHGYRVHRELLSWSADEWAHVKAGSLYHALRQMTKTGLLERVDTEEGDGGPERTVYRITPEGEREFFDLLVRELRDPAGDRQALSAAVIFLPALTRLDAIMLLRHRIVALEGGLGNARFRLDSFDSMRKPAHVRELFEIWADELAAGLAWTKNLVARLEAGEYTMAGE
ncbi:MAG: PadR family transcriptional regulator [Kutzneria sp.]|nr:PadR family transcriptional regulator [Kutzneria sp.]